jgi:hypothetical protein
MEKLKDPSIFLLDAVGAAFSILLLFLVYRFENFFGMPKNIITFFIGIASICFIYSTTIYLVSPSNWKFYLKIIAGLNFSYCLFTLFHVIKNYDSLTLYGLIYFIAEIIVILLLSSFELLIARKAN